MVKAETKDKIETALTQTPGAIPKHARVEEFLADEHLPGFYERQLAELEPGDPAASDLIKAAAQTRRAAAGVAANLAEYAAMDKLFLAMVAGGATEAEALSKVYGEVGEDGGDQ